jgi:putative SOS response-associated peptidase YedK
MCGRYTLFTKAEALEERFHALFPPEVYEATYNAAPSQEQLTILNENPHEIARALWGFVPAWADGIWRVLKSGGIERHQHLLETHCRRSASERETILGR